MKMLCASLCNPLPSPAPYRLFRSQLGLGMLDGMEVQIGMAALCARSLRAVHFVKLFLHRAKSGRCCCTSSSPSLCCIKLFHLPPKAMDVVPQLFSPPKQGFQDGEQARKGHVAYGFEATIFPAQDGGVGKQCGVTALSGTCGDNRGGEDGSALK